MRASPSTGGCEPALGNEPSKVGYRNLTHMLSRSGGLLERAEAALLNTVAANPNDAGALLRLGDVQRGKGRLDDALECYRRVAALRPDDSRASLLVAILSGEEPSAGVREGIAPRMKELPDAPAGARPAPFVRRTDFLPAPRCSELLAFVDGNRERFQPSGYGPSLGSVGPPSPMILSERRVTEQEVQPWFEARLRSVFPEALRRLRIPEPRRYWVEMATSAHLGGHFLTKHNDNGAPRFRTRTLSFAYYFHRRPRRFSGGDLLLHDGNGETATFTRIEPLHNSIVFFPAYVAHQTTAVEDDLESFGDGRFAISGWLRTYSAE